MYSVCTHCLLHSTLEEMVLKWFIIHNYTCVHVYMYVYANYCMCKVSATITLTFCFSCTQKENKANETKDETK